MTVDQEEIRDRVLSELDKLAGKPVERYQTIARAMNEVKMGSTAFCELLGKATGTLTPYGYIRNLSPITCVALSQGFIRKGVAKLLAEFREIDQPSLLRHIHVMKLKEKAALSFLEERLRMPQTIKQITGKYKQPWPVKKMEGISLQDELSKAAELTSTQPTTTPPPAPVQELEETPQAEHTHTDTEEAREDMRDQWSESTAALREHGFMPPEVSRALFGGKNDPYYIPPVPRAIVSHTVTQTTPEKKVVPEPAQKLNGHDKEGGMKNIFLPSIVGVDEKKTEAVVWILSRIKALSSTLLEITGTTLEEITFHPADAMRLRQMTIGGANNLSHFEELLVLSERRHQ